MAATPTTSHDARLERVRARLREATAPSTLAAPSMRALDTDRTTLAGVRVVGTKTAPLRDVDKVALALDTLIAFVVPRTQELDEYGTIAPLTAEEVARIDAALAQAITSPTSIFRLPSTTTFSALTILNAWRVAPSSAEDMYLSDDEYVPRTEAYIAFQYEAPARAPRAIMVGDLVRMKWPYNDRVYIIVKRIGRDDLVLGRLPNDARTIITLSLSDLEHVPKITIPPYNDRLPPQLARALAAASTAAENEKYLESFLKAERRPQAWLVLEALGSVTVTRALLFRAHNLDDAFFDAIVAKSTQPTMAFEESELPFQTAILWFAARRNMLPQVERALAAGGMTSIESIPLSLGTDLLRRYSGDQALDVQRYLLDTNASTFDFDDAFDGDTEEAEIMRDTRLPVASFYERVFAHMSSVTTFREPYASVSVDDPSLLGRRLRAAYGRVAWELLFQSVKIASRYTTDFFPGPVWRTVEDEQSLIVVQEAILRDNESRLYVGGLHLGYFTVFAGMGDDDDEEALNNPGVDFFDNDGAPGEPLVAMITPTPPASIEDDDASVAAEVVVDLARLPFEDLLDEDNIPDDFSDSYREFHRDADRIITDIVGPSAYYARADVRGPPLGRLTRADTRATTVFARPSMYALRATLAPVTNDFEAAASVDLPEYVLMNLLRANVPMPYTFELRSPSTGIATHVGVREFSTEGDVRVPERVFTLLGVEPNTLLELTVVTLPAARSVTFRPASDTLEQLDVEAILRAAFERYAAVSVGDVLGVMAGRTLLRGKITAVDPPTVGGVMTRVSDLAVVLDEPAKRRRVLARTRFTAPPALDAATAYAARAAEAQRLQSPARFAAWYTAPNTARDGALDVVLIDARADAVAALVRTSRCDVCRAALLEPANLNNGLGLALTDRDVAEEPFPLAALARHAVASDDDADADYVRGIERRDTLRYLDGADHIVDVRHLECTLYRALVGFVEDDGGGDDDAEHVLAYEAMPEDWLWSMLLRMPTTRPTFAARFFAALALVAQTSGRRGAWARYAVPLLRARLAEDSDSLALAGLRRRLVLLAP